MPSIRPRRRATACRATSERLPRCARLPVGCSPRTARLPSASRDLLADLIAFDTTSRLSNLALIEHVRAYLAGLGVESELLFNHDRSKANLYARIGPSGPGGVMLSGHSDVVPADGQPWTLAALPPTARAS